MTKITKDEFLALPPKERKRLAAIRSREISIARRAGLAVPPTYGEEFGLTNRKPRTPAAPTIPTKSEPKPSKSGIVPKEEVESSGVVLHHTVVPRGEVPSEFRFILGNLHWVSGYDLEEYQEEAKKRDLEYEIPYFESGHLSGIVFLSETTRQGQLDRILTVLIGSRPSKHFSLGKVVPLGESIAQEV